MKANLNLILFLLAFSVKAQQYQLFTAPSDKSMRVKWMSKNTDASAAYDLFRKDNGGSWQKINSQPIAASPVIKKSELTTAKNLFPKDSAYAMYVEYKNNKEATPNKQAYADYTLSMAAVYDNAMAKHLGIFYDDTSVEKGKKYQYQLVQSGSQKELAVSAEMGLTDSFAAPSDFKGKQNKQDVKFDWKVSETFISYNLYRNGSKVNPDPILANLEGKTYLVSYTDANLKPGTYQFTVKGVTYLNTESQPSAEFKIEVKDQTPPSPIKGFKAEKKETEIAMQWKTSTDRDLKGYHLYKSIDKGKTFKKLNDQPIDAKTTQFTEKLSGNSGSFQYYVEAIDEAGNATQSVKSSVFVPDNQAPETPKSLVSKPESGKISLSWSANTEKDLAGYRIYRGLADDDQNSMLLLNVTPQTATTFLDTFPKKAQTKFIYKVSALDQSFNESAKASAWVQLPDITPPAAPVLMEPKLSGDEVSLQWSEIVTDAIAGYDVYRVIDGNKTKINSAKVTTTTFSEKSARKGLQQYYVTAIDSAGLESKPSNNVYTNTGAGKISDVKLMLSQDSKTRKVQIEVVGVEPTSVQLVKLYRKDGDTGFRVVPFQYGAGAMVDETSEPGKIYEYYAEFIDWGDQKMKSAVVNFNNP